MRSTRRITLRCWRLRASHGILIPPERSERSPLHDVRNHARRIRGERRQITSGRADSGSISTDWWSQTGSNRRPPACKAGALPTELWPLVQRQAQIRLKAGLPSRSSRQPARLRLSAPARQPSASLRERRLVGLGRFELPTSRLSSARSNQLSYKPLRLENGRSRAPSTD